MSCQQTTANDLASLAIAMGAMVILVILVWATNRLLNRKDQGRGLVKSPHPTLARLVCRALLLKNTPDTQTGARMLTDEPLPVLDGQPPHYAIYAENAGDPPTYCSCHGFRLTDGEHLLIWPVEALLCKHTYSDQGTW